MDRLTFVEVLGDLSKPLDRPINDMRISCGEICQDLRQRVYRV